MNSRAYSHYYINFISCITKKPSIEHYMIICTGKCIQIVQFACKSVNIFLSICLSPCLCMSVSLSVNLSYDQATCLLAVRMSASFSACRLCAFAIDIAY